MRSHARPATGVVALAAAPVAALLAVAAVPAASPAAVAGAQTPRVIGSLDVGAASVAYDEFLRSGLLSVVPAVRFETARATLVARGAFSRFEGGNRSVQGTLAGSFISPQLFGVRGEAFATVSSTRYSDSVAATNVFALGRVHAANPRAGAWVGLGGGFVSQLSLFPNDLLQVDLGAWTRLGNGLYTLTVTPTRVGPARLTDVVLAGRWQGPRTELSASAGWRAERASIDIPGADQWIEGFGTLWMTRRLALVLGAGIFPADVLQGLPGGRYGSAALRVGTRRALTSDPALRAELTLPYEMERLRRNARPGAFSALLNPDGTRTLRVVVPGARRVELMGDFTDWVPVALVPGPGNTWAFEVFLAPGVHRVNLRVDGGEWLVPPGLAAARDEFGGEVGLLVVQ